jgi:plastocyanin
MTRLTIAGSRGPDGGGTRRWRHVSRQLPSADAAGGRHGEVAIGTLAFRPSPLIVTPGATVTWTNATNITTR